MLEELTKLDLRNGSARVQEINADRISRAFMLSEAMINLSRQGLKRRHPELSPDELDVLFIEHCYGPDLAKKFQVHLKERRK